MYLVVLWTVIAVGVALTLFAIMLYDRHTISDDTGHTGVEPADEMDPEQFATLTLEQVSPQRPKCPSCNALMVRHLHRKGVKAGTEFWGCPNFPHCRTILNIKE